MFVFVLLGIFLFVFYGEVAVRREREAEKQWRRERENGRNEFGGPATVKTRTHKKIESGFESSLDSKTAEGVNSNLPWDPHKIQVRISILI